MHENLAVGGGRNTNTEQLNKWLFGLLIRIHIQREGQATHCQFFLALELSFVIRRPIQAAYLEMSKYHIY